MHLCILNLVPSLCCRVHILPSFVSESGRKYFQRKRVPFQMPNSSQTEIYVHFVFMFGFNLANVLVFKNILPGGSGSFYFYPCGRNKEWAPTTEIY